jgi:hypothetical protein
LSTLASRARDAAAPLAGDAAWAPLRKAREGFPAGAAE